MMARQGIDPARLFLAAAIGLALWLGATFLWYITYGTGTTLPAMLLLDQDFPALLLGITGLALCAPWARGQGATLAPPTAPVILALIALVVLTAWAGHYWLLQDYMLSRDEEVSRFAAAYLREGMIARPIPPEWVPYRRAIMPEFFSPFGAQAYWAAAYLPVNSTIQAIFWRLGDPDLASPALLGIGLLALWRVAVRLFPDRPDAQWVTMLLAFTSAQLWVTAMTPFAMTGHFALDMVWLALVLRGGWTGHLCAALVALIAAGLHQWHFPPIFIAPFILWMLLQRRWTAAAFHAVILVAIVILWARWWPDFLLHALGPPSDVRPSAGVADKVGSLFDRLADKWQPLVNLTRMVAWNNLLLVPLALLGIFAMPWRRALRGQEIVLPLALGSIAGCALALAQGYGWGYRYAHGFIGPLCLLGGFGWIRMRAASLRPIWIATIIALLTGAFLSWRAHDFVAPYAAGHRMIAASKAQVVLVDPRGGMFVTDLVRGKDGVPGDPMVMNLGMLNLDEIDTLCRDYIVELFDRNEFRPLGVPLTRWHRGRVDALRRHMAKSDCDQPVKPLPPEEPPVEEPDNALNMADNALNAANASDNVLNAD